TGIHLTQLEVVAKQIPTPSEARQEIYGESGVTWGSRAQYCRVLSRQYRRRIILNNRYCICPIRGYSQSSEKNSSRHSPVDLVPLAKPNSSRCLSSTRLILPEMVFGSS